MFYLWCQYSVSNLRHHSGMKEEGIPMKNQDPFTRDDQTRFTMRIDSELLKKVKAEAEKNKRSTAKQIEFMIEQYLAEHP